MADEPLVIDGDDRYARLRLIAWWDQAKLAAAKVLVVGAGALGNEVLKNLALLGVGHVYIVDFDRIDGTNLSRSVLFRARDCGRPKAEVAAAALADINPDVHARALPLDIVTGVGLGLFREMDVVIGCLDNREARLWVNRCAWKTGKPWIDGGIQEINGVAKVFVPPDGACYECAMTENDYRLINLRYSCPLLRREEMLAGKVPTAPTIASIIAGLQTQEALKLIHGLEAAAGKALVFNGAANQFYTTAYQRREDCLSHETYPAPVALPLSAAGHTARQLFAAVRTPPGDLAPGAAHDMAGEAAAKLVLELDRDLVASLDCGCGDVRPVMKPLHLVGQAQAVCPRCGQMAQPRLVHRIEEDGEFADRLLCELGVPPYDIVRVSSPRGEVAVLLHADRESFASL